VRLSALVGMSLAACLAVVLAVPAASLPSTVPSPSDASAAPAAVAPSAPGTREAPAAIAADDTSAGAEGVDAGGGAGTSGWLHLAGLGAAAVPSTELTKALGALRAKYAIPGISATIIWPDGRSWTATSGFADLYGKVRLTRSTAFAIASVTKTFVSALILQLAQEGRLSLDDPVIAWLPAARNVTPTVTVRQLLDHTSGVYDFFSNSAIDAPLRKTPSAAWSPAKTLSYVKAPYFEPGTGWHYSNTNYVLLGQVAEAVTGNPWSAELRARFFDPLNLSSVYVQGAERVRTTISHGYRFTSTSRTARAVDLWDRTGVAPFRSVVTAAGAAGAVAASSWDLARWTRALFGGQLLSGGALGTMLDTASTSRYRYAVPYGMGVQQYTIGGRIAYGHGGRLMGARSAIRYIASEGISIAVVMNTDRADPAVIAAALLEVTLPALPPPTPTPLPTPIVPPPTPIVPPATPIVPLPSADPLASPAT
jgi:D-alanyl-D-alanine carboxypeptidase